MGRLVMESILCGLLGMLSVALGMYIGFYMSKPKAKEKDEILQNKERKECLPGVCCM